MNGVTVLQKQPITLMSWRENWEQWVQRYIAPGTRDKAFDLVVDELGSEVYSFPLVTDAFSKEVIAHAEATADWSNDRHNFFPTTDVILKDLGLEELYHKILLEFAHPIARRVWGLKGERWTESISEENFMARYRAQDQQHLSVHHDFSDYTFTLGLNTDFVGGGTYFPRQQILANPRGGYASLFPSITHPHGGRPTTQGTRYIIVSFCKRPNLYIE